jgi:2-polyprenyl-3-methyl-5-hydroxy-6-metoxy-1,4-benzoquinol methylase
MNSMSPEGKSEEPNLPRAKEAEWYDHHYQTRDITPGSLKKTDRELIRHLGPWYTFALPHLRKTLTTRSRLLELGCGSGRMPVQLVQEGLVAAGNVYGLDQSKVAVERAAQALPGSHFGVGDIYNLQLPKSHFDVVMLMEVIEHLETPAPALTQIASVTAPGGYLYISFPNFLHLPWLVVRILAEKLNRPNWVVLQPVDKIYTVRKVRKLVEAAGFRFECGIGSSYGPPLLDRLEQPWMAKALNRFGLWWLSYHPILVFRKGS